ncbi:MAG: ABC transporter permease [Aquificae bacterium]|nr:ABC transporter permease [Aquificota bacterium]
MELILTLLGIIVLIALLVIMFILGYEDALKTKVEDPFAYEDMLVVGEGWDTETLLEYERLVDTLGRELTDEEMRIFLDLVEEGYHGDTLIKKFFERVKKLEHH